MYTNIHINMTYDPLLQYEQEYATHHSHHRPRVSIMRMAKFMSIYLIMTGSIFAVLM